MCSTLKCVVFNEMKIICLESKAVNGIKNKQLQPRFVPLPHAWYVIIARMQRSVPFVRLLSACLSEIEGNNSVLLYIYVNQVRFTVYLRGARMKYLVLSMVLIIYSFIIHNQNVDVSSLSVSHIPFERYSAN